MYGYVHTYGYPVTGPPRTAFPRREEGGWGGGQARKAREGR